MSAAWTALLQRAVAHGLLPPEALEAREPGAGQPWPVVLLSLFGAQLAAAPFIAFVLMLFGETLQRGIGPYLLGPLIIVGACVVLRSQRLALFVENLALVALMVGTGLLYFGILRDLPADGHLVCAVIAMALAVVVPVNWVRALLGAAAAGLCYGSVFEELRPDRIWYIALVQTLAWACGLWVQRKVLLRSDHARIAIAIALEWILAGWLMQVLASLALLSGMSFMATGVLGGDELGAMLAQEATQAAAGGGHHLAGVQAALSALLCLAAGAWGVARWASLRSVAGGGLIAVLAGLAWFMPALGPAVFIGMVTLVTRRPLQAGAAAFAAAWIIGSFYYTLRWDLVTKALVLIAAGIVLGVLAWWTRPRRAMCAGAATHASSNTAFLLMALAVVASLGVVNIGIWQKETLIAHGRPVFIRLAPVDPRSLMQGDYMALNFEMPPDLQVVLAATSRLGRPSVIATIDMRGVATLTRLATAAAAAPIFNEIRIELTPGNGRWVVVSDAWFFKEGEGARWGGARYGEFRVRPDGQALLVGLADENLVRLGQ